MTLAQLVADVSYKSTGKVNAYTTGSVKWLKTIAIANQYIRQWAQEYGSDWSSLYDPAFSLGTVTATDTFAIPTTVLKLSDKDGDFVRINYSNGVGYTDYTIVPHDDLKMYYAGQTKQSPFGFYCAQIGSNLVFNHTFTATDQEFGGTIKVPVYNSPAELSADADVVPVDIPMWLVLMVSAEIVRNDATRSGQYPNLINEANSLMARMRENNDAQLDTVYMPWSPTASQGAFD